MRPSPLTMLGIITCLRARALARDWAYHVWLLERTLNSMVAQTNREFKVIVVCHEIPHLPLLKGSMIDFLSVDFPPPVRTNDDMCVDKVLKLTAGIDSAIAAGCDYIMFADGDDLVSRRLSQFVAENNGKNGWYCGTQYIYRYGMRWVRKSTSRCMEAGPFIIIRSDLLRFALDPMYRGQRVNTLAAIGHTEYRKLLIAQGNPVEPLPFPGIVYILHEDATSQVPGLIGSDVSASLPKRSGLRRALGHLKRNAQKIPDLRPLTTAMRLEFTVPSADQIPAAYRNSSVTTATRVNVLKA
jgi:hypothetical protein